MIGAERKATAARHLSGEFWEFWQSVSSASQHNEIAELTQTGPCQGKRKKVKGKTDQSKAKGKG